MDRVKLTVSDEYGNMYDATHTVKGARARTKGNTLLYALAGAIVIGVSVLYLREKR